MDRNLFEGPEGESTIWFPVETIVITTINCNTIVFMIDAVKNLSTFR